MINKELTDDVIYEFRCKMQKHQDGAAVTQALLAENREELEDIDDRIPVLMGIVLAQKEYNCLDLSLKEELISWIDSEIESGAWNKSEISRHEKAKQKIEAERTPKKPRIPNYLDYCPWQNGDVFAYRFCEHDSIESKYAYFVKGEDSDWLYGSIAPIVYFYNVVSKNLITDINRLQQYGYMIQCYYPSAYIRHPEAPPMYRLQLDMKKRDYSSKKLTYIGKIDESVLFSDSNKNDGLRLYSQLSKYIPERVKTWEIPCIED